MDKREIKLLKEITPIIKKLNKDWFPSDKKTPEGLFYACWYCDQNCGQHNSHDKDCFYQVAKETMDAWIEIDNNKEIEISILTKKKRSNKDIKELRDFKKVMAILELFFPNILRRITPFKYKKDSVICECRSFDLEIKSHSKDCIRQNLAKIISDFYNPKN